MKVHADAFLILRLGCSLAVLVVLRAVEIQHGGSVSRRSTLGSDNATYNRCEILPVCGLHEDVLNR